MTDDRPGRGSGLGSSHQGAWPSSAGAACSKPLSPTGRPGRPRAVRADADPGLASARAGVPDAADDRRLGWGLLVGAALGLGASAVLLVERLRLAEDPTYVPSCSLNPVLSCGSVMASSQASLLGFPNPVLGVGLFPIVVTTAVVLLTGARLPRWYWLGLQLGVTAALALVGWLVFQSVYRIGALCPYCMVVWAVVVPMFWYLTLRNAKSGVFGARLARSPALRVVQAWHAPILLLVVLGVLALVGVRFWSYWSTLV